MSKKTPTIENFSMDQYEILAKGLELKEIKRIDRVISKANGGINAQTIMNAREIAISNKISYLRLDDIVRLMNVLDVSDVVIIERFLKYKETTISPITTNFYRFKLVKAMEYFHKPLKEITPLDIHDYARYLKMDYTKEKITLGKSKLNNGSINVILAILKSFWSYLDNSFEDEFNNVAKKIKMKHTKHKVVHLTTDEINQMIESTQRLRDKCLIQGLFLTGMRAEAFINLDLPHTDDENNKWMDEVNWIDLDAGKVHINKTKSQKRTFKIPNWETRLKPLLIPYLKSDEYKQPRNDKYAMFVSDFGNRISYSQFQRIIKLAAIDSGITVKDVGSAGPQDVSPHVLRHSAITEYYKTTKDPVKTMLFAGHTKFETTKIYINLVDGTELDNDDVDLYDDSQPTQSIQPVSQPQPKTIQPSQPQTPNYDYNNIQYANMDNDEGSYTFTIG